MRRFGFGSVYCVLCSILICTTTSAATYFVSPSGNDANSGLSSNLAWRTVNKLNTINFVAGDKILFEGGKTFSGKIYLDSGDTGSAANPIVVSSYGTGRPTISAGTDNGFFAYNTGGILLSNVNFVGAGATVSSNDGVVFYADAAGSVKFSGITVDTVEVSGFGGTGVVLGSWNGQTGFRGARIANVSSHDNLRAGFATYAQSPDTHQNIYVGHCAAYNNYGDPASSGNTGNGIVFGNVNGGTIERCVAHDNGRNNFAPTEGPVGIWAYDSVNVVIQFNESYSNHTASAKDGGGFDLDINTRTSTLQYNYSHENDGAGFLVCGSASNAANVVRYNISQNDGRRNGYAAIHTYGNINGAEVYQNTVYISQATGSPRAVWLSSAATNIHLRNNVFYSTGGARLIEVVSGQTGVEFQGNCYFATGTFSIFWDGVNYSGFGAWRSATQQEYNGTNKVGLNVDPRLSNPGAGGALNNADLLPTLAAYKLQTNSPVVDGGLNLTSLYGLKPGSRDFFGTALVQGAAADIGACELPIVAPQPINLEITSTSISNGMFTLAAIAAIGSTNAVEVSTNFSQWTALTNLVSASGAVEFREGTTRGQPAKFYRLRTLQ